MMKMMKKNNKIVIYQAKSGAIELRTDASRETMWASQKQLSEVFGVDVRTINEHIKNIFKTKELMQKPVIRKFRIVQTEGERQISREIEHYNLDMIISVGYRVNSKTATRFRQWATKTLRSHITEGYTINPSRIKSNYQNFLRAVEDVKKLLPAGGGVKTEDILELIKTFAGTWFSLASYDTSAFPKSGFTKRQVKFTADELADSLIELKKELIRKKETTELFGQERQKGSLAGIVGNVFQSVFGKDAYPTAEEKATHLLYFIIKNHPFTDGNKRSGAFAFIWFLRKARLLNVSRLSPEALTAITLLIAESAPREKERMVGLVLLLLRQK